MAVAMTKTALASTAWERDSACGPARNPAVVGLLDHLAEELAREYVRLMEEAAKDAGAGHCVPGGQEG